MDSSTQLLQIQDLTLHFRVTEGVIHAVDGVDLELSSNRAVVILGESGCGKTSLSKALLRLLPQNVETYSGKVILQGRDLMTLNDDEFRKHIRWVSMAVVPQSAMNSLNPVMKIGEQITEPALLHLELEQEAALQLAGRMLKLVDIPYDFLDRYPFELSGGMRQRAVLAMALMTQPELIILDEPTSALDMLNQANLMNVLKRVKKDLGTTFVLITHDVAASSQLADEVAIMYAGQMVEMGLARDFFPAPLHPYSQMLMASVPRLRDNSAPMYISGQSPSLLNPPTGCRFAERCPYRYHKCNNEPPLIDKHGRKVKCWLYS